MLVVWWVAGVMCFSSLGVIVMGLCRARAKTPPRPVPDAVKVEATPRCHQCDEAVVDEPLKLTCYHCHDKHVYHTQCGFDMKHEQCQPRCFGTDVSHSSGHFLSLKYPQLCAHCGLGRQYWSRSACTPQVVERRRLQ